MILYRDHRSTLEESMETVKVFESEDEMLEYLRDNILRDYGLAMFSRVLNVKITIDPEEHTDDRIGWDRYHYVCANGKWSVCVTSRRNANDTRGKARELQT